MNTRQFMNHRQGTLNVVGHRIPEWLLNLSCPVGVSLTQTHKREWQTEDWEALVHQSQHTQITTASVLQPISAG